MESRWGLSKELRLGWGPGLGPPPCPAGRESRLRRGPPGPLQPVTTYSRPLPARSRDSFALGLDGSPSVALRVRNVAGVARATVRPSRSGPGRSAQSRSPPHPAPPRPQRNGRAAMTSRRAGRASRSLEMEEKELLRRQIRLLQGGSGWAGVACPFFPLTSPDSLSARSPHGRTWSGGRQVVSDRRWETQRGFRAGRVGALIGFRWTDNADPSGAAAGRSLTNLREAAPPLPRAGASSASPRSRAGQRGGGSGAGWQNALGRGRCFFPDALFLRTVTPPLVFQTQAPQASVSKLFNF